MNETLPRTAATTGEPAKAKSESGATIQGPGIRWSSILIWGAIVVFLAILGWGLINSSATRPEAGATAPDFQMQFFDDYRWNDLPASNLEEMRGNVVVLNFWASWCVECRLEADLLENAWRQYRDQGVVFLGVAYVDAEPKSLAYMQEYGVTYPNAPDLGSAISESYRITGVPETFFIDKDGNISRVVIGPVSGEVLHNEIAQLLAE